MPKPIQAREERALMTSNTVVLMSYSSTESPSESYRKRLHGEEMWEGASKLHFFKGTEPDQLLDFNGFYKLKWLLHQ